MESPKRRKSLEMRLPTSAAGLSYPSTSLFDELEYKWTVRRIRASLSEAALSNDLHRLALEHGIDLPTRQQEPQVEHEPKALNSSMSGVTATSDTTTNMQSSIATQSTAPTSCSSSERRPPTRSSGLSGTVATPKPIQPLSPSSSKRNSAFRARMLKMVRLGKKDHTPGESHGSNSDIDAVVSPVYRDVQLPVDQEERAPSIRSNKSSWSNAPAAPAKQEVEVDAEALKRSLDCPGMTSRQNAQLEERARFIAYRNAAMEQLGWERFGARADRRTAHEALLQKKRDQDQCAIEELENKHLGEELRMAEEHKLREQMMNSRLRRIERFVHHPTPPPESPEDDLVESDGSTDRRKSSFPPRSAGPADFNHLAEQYREQKNLVHVHVARINVLRGQQQKRLDALIEQKEKEMEALEEMQRKDIASIDEEFDQKEKALAGIFDDKRKVLELYWRQCAHYELERQQRNTGMKFQSLPPITVD